MTNQQILEQIGRPAAAELAAEECIKLAQALLRYSRMLRAKDPAPAILEKAWDDAKKEYDNVIVNIDVAGLTLDVNRMYQIKQNWVRRLKEEDSQVLGA